jgi:hypothetical protein
MEKIENKLDKILTRILIILQIVKLFAEIVWLFLLSIVNYLANLGN